jgi:hypothetical protein
VVTSKRKKAISIRLASSDVRLVKAIASRLGARDSDVVRFALKLLLGRVALLADGDVRGRRMIPMLVEIGDELIRHFELDASRLRALVNDGVSDSQRVEDADITLMALSASGANYVDLQLEESHGSRNPTEGIRHYLIDKYVHRPRVVSSREADLPQSMAVS